jgi:hypothetical protein
MYKKTEQSKRDLLELMHSMNEETRYLQATPANARHLAESVRQYQRGNVVRCTMVAGTPERFADTSTRFELTQQAAAIGV